MNPANTFPNQNQESPQGTALSFGQTDPPPSMPAFQAMENDAATAPVATPPDGQSQAPPPGGDSSSPPMVNSSKKGSRRNKILASLGIVLMLLGIGAGVLIVRNNQLTQSFAWDCSQYTFLLDPDGTVRVQNGSTIDESAQLAMVYINGSLVDTFDVPALDSGSSIVVGTVVLPTNQSYSWRIEGSKDCENSDTVTVENQTTASCSPVIAYDEDWAQLTASDLSNLEEGDVVRFAVTGTASAGTFDKARFSVNGAAPVEVTDLRPGSEDFYYEYTIPVGTETFSVNAEIHHSEYGWF